MAGKGRTAKLLPRLKKLADAQSADFTFYTSEYPQHASLIADAIQAEFDGVIAFGGDGTANEVVNGLAGTQTPLGIVPEGTGNDFARSINMPQELDAALNIIMNYRIRKMDLGTIGDRIFLNGVGVGFDGYVNLRNKTDKLIKGPASYYLTLITSLISWKAVPLDMEIDGEKFKNLKFFLIAVGNGWACGGGMNLNPQASIHDGVFDICYVKDISTWKIVLNLMRLKNGTIDRINEVCLTRGKQITLKSPAPLPVHFDGEMYDFAANEINISLIPAAANIIGNW